MTFMLPSTLSVFLSVRCGNAYFLMQKRYFMKGHLDYKIVCNLITAEVHNDFPLQKIKAAVDQIR